MADRPQEPKQNEREDFLSNLEKVSEDERGK